MIAGEACRLIQLVPRAFVVRMVRAIDEETAERTGDKVAGGSSAAGAGGVVDTSPHSLALEEALGGISLRVWAELGRARMPLGTALGLPVGAVVDLDRAADAPVDLYVNGTRFARGQLVVTDDGEWAVSLDGLESEGLRMLDLARSTPAEDQEDVEPDPQSLEIEADRPIEDRDPTTDPRPRNPRSDANRSGRSSDLMARVLVVDDAAFMRKVVSDALASGGHEVVGEAGNGTEAVAQFQALSPELTTLDITMPEKDGLQALAEIIALDPGARVLMCSALGQESKVIESIQKGAKDFVVKPFQPAQLLEAVGKALAIAASAAASGADERKRRVISASGPSSSSPAPDSDSSSSGPSSLFAVVGLVVGVGLLDDGLEMMAELVLAAGLDIADPDVPLLHHDLAPRLAPEQLHRRLEARLPALGNVALERHG